MAVLFNHTTQTLVAKDASKWSITRGGNYISVYTDNTPKRGDIIAVLDEVVGKFTACYRVYWSFQGTSAVNSVVQIFPLDNLEIMAILGKTAGTSF